MKHNINSCFVDNVIKKDLFKSSLKKINFIIDQIKKSKEPLLLSFLNQFSNYQKEELKNAKNYLINSYVLRLDSNTKVASILLNTQMDGLNIDFFEKRNDYINSVSLEDIKKVASRILDENQIFFLVIGNPTDLKNANKI